MTDVLELMPHMREPRLKDYQEIILEKAVDTAGPMPVGATFDFTYKSLSRDQALQRASKQLEYVHKGEDRLNWSVVQ